jgi:3-hydroxybutyryl-CoA dehydrogenase
MDKSNHRALVVGGGIMGCGIAAGFLARGWSVALLVREPSRCTEARDKTASLLASLGEAARADALSVQDIDGFSDWAGLTLAIETVKEDLPLKQRIFAWLDGHVPAGVPIGSNSSSFGISRIAHGLPTRQRMFGMHYFMPAHQVPLVEVVLGVDSDPALAATVCELFRSAGKKPVIVKRDIPGFIANRIQHALMREMLSLIDAGVASPEDIDQVVRYSFGFRYAAIGPILQKEISGWDTTASAAREIYPHLSNTAEVPACLQRLVAEGKTGMKSGQGFLAWTPESARAVREGYEARLAAALRLLE